MQRAVSHLLEESVNVALYEKKRDMLCDGLASFGYEFVKPQTVPGSGFGGPGHFRISCCVADEVIEKAMPGFERTIKKYKTS